MGGDARCARSLAGISGPRVGGVLATLGFIHRRFRRIVSQIPADFPAALGPAASQDFAEEARLRPAGAR